MMYALENANDLYLMQVDGSKRDYSFTAEKRLAMKFDTEQEAIDKRAKLPLFTGLVISTL